MKVEKQARVVEAGTPTEAQLERINLQTKSPVQAEEVYCFAVRLCDDEVDRDFERFSPEALEKLAELFVGKTGVVDHTWSSEKQLARVFEAGVEYADGRAFLKAWAYMLRGERTDGVIREIEAGIKREVSVGCAMGKSICSICGADYGSCGHEKGQVYGGKTCVAVLCEPLDAYEFSFVAVPAQRCAGVMKRMEDEASDLDRYAMRALRKQAELGRVYRKALQERVARLTMLVDLGLERDLVERMVSALDVEQLQAAEKGLAKKVEALYPPVCQLAERQEAAGKTDSAFLI